VQVSIINEIANDFSRPFPMLRLVQGDVGSGKTVVAMASMLQTIENGHQAAMMAPTELLAEQHYHNFIKWLGPLGVSVVLLHGHIKGKQRNAVLQAIASGDAKIVIGTQALFQEEVKFYQLALVVVD